MNGICGYCGETLTPDEAVEHFRERHPGMDWSMATWPDGEQVLWEPVQ